MSNSRSEVIKPLPFPGESPTVALALAAGNKYGLTENEEKRAASKAKPRKAAKTSKTARKTARKTAKPAGKSTRAR